MRPECCVSPAPCMTAACLRFSTDRGVRIPPLQLLLLAYHVAVYRGTDIDQPRNLAKSVTVVMNLFQRRAV